MVRWLLAAFVLAIVGRAAFAQTAQEGDAFSTKRQGFSVSDGDTVKYGKQLVRMLGIDAPEKGQACDDGAWLPGPLATKALVDFIGGRPVACHQVDYDKRNKRPVARCFADGDDLQSLMVSAGWAWAYTEFSDQYVAAEEKAVARRAGVHAHRCEKPWEWRARVRGR